MQNIVAQIIDVINTGYVFDSHFVISQIIKIHSDQYIHFAGPKETTAQMHGRIAQLISSLPTVKLITKNSWSDNIHGTPSECALWEKL